jgi:hypothetical protein
MISLVCVASVPLEVTVVFRVVFARPNAVSWSYGGSPRLKCVVSSANSFSDTPSDPTHHSFLNLLAICKLSPRNLYSTSISSQR